MMLEVKVGLNQHEIKNVVSGTSSFAYASSSESFHFCVGLKYPMMKTGSFFALVVPLHSFRRLKQCGHEISTESDTESERDTRKHYNKCRQCSRRSVGRPKFLKRKPKYFEKLSENTNDCFLLCILDTVQCVLAVVNQKK